MSKIRSNFLMINKWIYNKSVIPFHYKNCLTEVPISLNQTIPLKKYNNYFSEITISYKSIFYTIFFIFLTFPAISSDAFINYYKYVNEAEKYISQKEYYKSTICYDSAFNIAILQQIDPMARDIHNSIISSYIIKNNILLKKYLNLMIKYKCLNPKYYKTKIFKNIITKQNFLKIDSSYKFKNNHIVNKLINNKVEIDQKIRTKNNYINEKTKIKEVDSLTYLSFMDYVLKNGFPSEKLVIDYPNNEPSYYILLRHWFQQNFQIDSLTLYAVKNLYLRNINYAELKDLSQGRFLKPSDYAITIFIKYKRNIKQIKFTETEILSINNNRNNIGLDTVNEYVEKVACFKNTKYFYYNIGKSLSVFKGSNAKIIYDSL